MGGGGGAPLGAPQPSRLQKAGPPGLSLGCNHIDPPDPPGLASTGTETINEGGRERMEEEKRRAGMDGEIHPNIGDGRKDRQSRTYCRLIDRQTDRQTDRLIIYIYKDRDREKGWPREKREG